MRSMIQLTFFIFCQFPAPKLLLHMKKTPYKPMGFARCKGDMMAGKGFGGGIGDTLSRNNHMWHEELV